MGIVPSIMLWCSSVYTLPLRGKQKKKKKQTEKKRKDDKAELPEPGDCTCTCVYRHAWMVFTCWTSHLCSVEMGTGRCCWSRSWHRHSGKTKWTRLQIQCHQERKIKRDERGEGGFHREVLTLIYVSYCVSFVAALMKVSLSFLLCSKGQGFQPAVTFASLPHPRTLPTCIFRRIATRAFLTLRPDSIEEQVKTAKAYWPNGGTLRLLQSGAGH